MGTPIGFFGDDTPVDYPELNKCPDCETFFQGDCCPLCGKECPPEMRAGNRKAPPKRKPRRRDSGRVRFVPWYYSAWFIVAMLIVFPVAGLILLWTSDYAKGWKIGGTVGLVAFHLLSGPLVTLLFNHFDKNSGQYVRPTMPESAYKESCQPLDAEAYYRQPGQYPEGNVYTTVTVLDEWESQDGVRMWRCRATGTGQSIELLLTDCLEEELNLLPGDRITVWGKTAGTTRAYADDRSLRLPGITVYYLRVEKTASVERDTETGTLCSGFLFFCNFGGNARRMRSK